MKNKTRIITTLCLTLGLLILTGCSVKFDPTESSLFVRKDGTVVSAEIESFDNSSFEEARYNEDELKTFVEDTVKAYNKEKVSQEFAYEGDTEEDLAVSIESLEVESNVATLLLNYATCEDFLAFNGAAETVTGLTIQTAVDAVSAGVSLDGMKDAEGNDVDTTKMASSDRYYVVTVTGETSLIVDGKITAVSGGASISDKHTVKVSGDETAYILFK